MVPLAPRYPPTLVAALYDLDDPKLPIAEVCRRLGDVADELRVARPSYVHVWRLVRAKRAYEDEEARRRAQLRAIAGDVATDLLLGKRVDAYAVARRVENVRSN